MNPYHQKPDALTPVIRAILRRRGKAFIEPGNGFGCDIVIFEPGEVVFVEIKDPAEKDRLTPAEELLRRICQIYGLRYLIWTTIEEAESFT